jgi:hypothetical protein
VTVLTRGEAVRRQQVLRSPAHTAAVAVRTGRTVRVLVQTPGFAAIERVEVVSFARGPVAPSDRRGSVQADARAMTERVALRRALSKLRATYRLARSHRGLGLSLGGDGELLLEACYQPRGGDA